MTKKRPSRTIRNLMAACLALALVGGGEARFIIRQTLWPLLFLWM